MTTDPNKTDVLNAISEVLAWAEVGIQSIPRGKTVPDLNYLGKIIREYIAPHQADRKNEGDK